ncbi:MAG TPA: ABC transporter ATP-binding protein, partial [Candidatus Eremiobacteraceae bacterium]|nr:ABC transporter ATP-binding protein [Candidatus Eremiobacteraceae bacterium]
MDLLRGQGLAVTYGTRTVFRGLDIAVPSSRFVALIGPNGGGKSSLLRVLAGVQPPSAGTVTRAGRVALIAPAGDPPGDLTPLDLASYGLAMQRRFWQWSLPFEEERRIRDALARCNVIERADEPMTNLSTGEVQRVWIAAALVTAPDVLLVDEPTTHLDLRFQVEILQTLLNLTTTGVSVVVAIHDLTLASRFANDVALIANGRLQIGPPDEILEPGALSEAFGVSVSTHRHPEHGYLI